MADHVPPAQWLLALSNATNSTAYPTSATNGVAVPNGRLNEYSHIMVDVNTACSVDVMGYAVPRGVPTTETALDAARWVVLETFTKTIARPWAEPLTGATAYQRIAVVRTDQNANSAMNAYVGLCEHFRGYRS